MLNPHLATFAIDVTPPDGHPLCGGWIEPVRGVDDPLRALGVILLGNGDPVVLVGVDWCGARNEANILWRAALAEAVGTHIDRVAVHCVHPHNAPFADVGAQKLIAAVKGPPSLDLKYFDRVVAESAKAAKAAIEKAQPFTHVGIGAAKVDQVASNRRVIGEDGKVKFTRTSSTKDPVARAEPEGTTDPVLKTLSFWNGPKCLAALHYYATHPMSYYGDGRVSADFCGLARQKMQDASPETFQVYFTGCAGNVTAGKYNDGSKENRGILRDRMFAGMKAAFQATKRMPADAFEWRVEPLKLPARTEARFGAAESRKVLDDPKQSNAARNNAAFHLAWLDRIDRPIPLTCLDFGGKVMVLHLPGEPFIEYQLLAQSLRPEAAVCVAGYGDGGTGYIPTAAGYLQGGYEPTVALVGPGSERILGDAMAKLLKAEAKK